MVFIIFKYFCLIMEGSGSVQINYGSGNVILTNRSGSGRPKIKKVEFSCEVVWRNKLKESRKLSIKSTCAPTPVSKIR
jgi:hypothetical protein